MVKHTTATRPTRLIPLWFTVSVVTLLSLFTVFFLVVGIAADGAMATASLLTAGATGSVLVAACASLTRRRPRVTLHPGPDGDITITSPLAITVGLLVAWFALLGVVAITCYAAITDFDGIEAPGAALAALLGALGSMPDLVRLVTGRLHRWRLTLTGDGVTYRGFRTSVSVPWGDLRRVVVQRRGPAGVRVDGRDASFVAPATAFTIPAEQLVDELRSRAR